MSISRRRQILIIAGAFVVVAVVVLLTVAPWRVEAGPDGPTDSATASSSEPEDASVSPALTGDASPPATTAPASQDAVDIADDDRAEVEENTDLLVEETFSIITPIDPDEDVELSESLTDLVSDTYLSEIEAERLEFESEGWTRTGSFQIGNVEILDYQENGDGASATVRVCVDSSDIVVTNADGEAVAGPSGDAAWNIFVLNKPADSGKWILGGRTFPDDPAC